MTQNNKFITILFCCLLTFSFPFTLFAESNDSDELSTGQYSAKDEVIYGKLNHAGQVEHLYVVNSFFVTHYGEIIDYGKYSNLKNLTNLTDIKSLDDNIVQFQADEDQFFYQGELNNGELPWNIDITYLLNNEQIHPNELAGQSGDLDIRIETDANKSVDPLFFEHYLLQISLTLDPLKFDNIQAPKGTEVNEGKNKQITFSVLPDKPETLIISATVNQLEMDPIQIAALPANILIEEPDTDSMTDDLQSLSSAIREVNSSVHTLKNGLSELNSGMTNIKQGSATYYSGINELNQSSNQLVNGSSDILKALQQMNKAISNGSSISSEDLNELKQLPKGLREIVHELNKIARFLNGLDEAIEAIPNQTVTKEQLAKLYESLDKNNVSKELVNVVKQLEGTYYSGQAVKQLKSQIPSQLGDGLLTIATQLDHIANYVEQNIGQLKQLDDLSELISGLTTLTSKYNTFHNGLTSYTNGVNKLATSYKDINTGLSDLTSGVGAISDGMVRLSEGTAELQLETDDLPGQMQSEIKEMLEDYDFSNFEPISFVSPKNKNIGVVQFVLQTEAIELDEEEQVEEEIEEEKGFWDRLINLFK